MSHRGWEAARRWAAHNEERAISTGVCIRRPKAAGGSGSATYYGSKFYSYSTVIACYHRSEAGERYVVVNSAKYSRTTDRHVFFVSSAASNNKVFCVPCMNDDGESRRENAVYLFNQARERLEEAKLKWKYDVPWEETAITLFNKAVDYTSITGCDYKPQWTFYDTVKDVQAYRKLKLDNYNQPVNVAKRERARARRLAIQVMGV